MILTEKMLQEYIQQNRISISKEKLKKFYRCSESILIITMNGQNRIYMSISEN